MTKIKVLQYCWGKYNNYLGLMPFNQVQHIINNDIDFSMNRAVDRTRVIEIINHIEKKVDNLFFPPVILNSDSGNTIRLNPQNSEINLEHPNKMKIIDGQHRLTAIKDIFTQDEYKELAQKLKNHKIPFVLIESLEPEEHRILFNEINQNAEKVGSVVSERFEPNAHNLICLRYIAENLECKKWVEWENEQSDEKIVYLHLVRCIELINKAISRVLKKNQFDTMFSYPLHKDDNYFGIMKSFLNAIFIHINKVGNDKIRREFWVKRVSLIAVTDALVTSLKALDLKSTEEQPIQSEEAISMINNTISDKLKEMLPISMYYKYVGSSSQTKSTYDAIQKYIYINRKLESLTVAQPDHEQFILLINRYIDLAETELSTDFEEDEQIEILAALIKDLVLLKDEIKKLNTKAISNMTSSEINMLIEGPKGEQE
ncbi:DGQHR domain [Lysinibacillus capsici]|uniref:DGQHR domain n=1 Tax=Lysinibacillus capsici TaxID=2115968 RepID=A0A2X0XC72_9BACI|nr:DGQHR domain-containing protein [Lysinibacillus capsici]SPT96479.1 DGQHR domain [Lysinibacillus capsici]